MVELPPAKGLKPHGKALWKAVTAGYSFRPDELSVLTDVCRMSDMMAMMETALEDEPTLLVRGSQGQLVINPLVSELRQYRSARAALLRQLKLPDLDDSGAPAADGEAGARSTSARNAANARWARRGA